MKWITSNDVSPYRKIIAKKLSLKIVQEIGFKREPMEEKQSLEQTHCRELMFVSSGLFSFTIVSTQFSLSVFALLRS